MEDGHKDWKAPSVNPSTVNGPNVSFYILAYNHQSMIQQAIEGALRQTYQPLEIIVSDDCSDDSTWQLIQQALADYSGPHSILARRNERNLGISQHINEVWKYCSGQWIVASAGDDISLPDRVEKIMMTVARNARIKLVQSWLEEVGHLGNHISTNTLHTSCGAGELRRYGLRDRIEGKSYTPHGAAMAYSRELIDKFPPLPERVIFEDNILNLRAELLGDAAVLAIPLVKHRNHDGQITQSNIVTPSGKQKERLLARLESDIFSTEQNILDSTLLEPDSDDQLRDKLPPLLRRRLRYFRTKKAALLLPWPVRLCYLAAIVTVEDVVPLSRNDFWYSLLPNCIYSWLKNRSLRRKKVDHF